MSRVKGWCPSAHRPMMSGDGLLVRVRPRMGQLSASAAGALCDLAERYGNGMIDLTSRANLQIRGVAEADHTSLLAELIGNGLADEDAEIEARRNIVVTPFWRDGDLTDRLGAALAGHLGDLPALPDKMGIALDTGQSPMLSGVSGDFRFERSASGEVLLRADGARLGRPVDEDTALEALQDMAAWFLATGGAESGRMKRHLARAALPGHWQVAEPARAADRPDPGDVTGGRLYGVPFGQIEARALGSLLGECGAAWLRVTPWRMLFLPTARRVDVPGFLTERDPLMDVAACPGQPGCAQATVSTRDLARRLAGRVDGSLHVSGCAKGCARQAPATMTLVGRDGRFDLVRNGRAGDTPLRTGLSEADVLEAMG